jgi:hypothetical protein
LTLGREPRYRHQVPGPTASRTALVLAVGAAAVLAAALVLPLRGQLGFPVSGQDEGQLLLYPVLLLHGGVPNGTFQSLYGPTNLWALALAFKAFGPTVAVERVVGVCYRAVIVASIAGLVGKRRGAGAAVVSGLTSVLFFNTLFGEAAMAWIAALALAALGVLLVDFSFGRRRAAAFVVAGGMAFGLAVGSRADFAVPVLLFCAATVVAERRVLVPLGAGLLAGCIPVFVNLAQAGPAAVVRGEILQPVFVSGPGRRIPWGALSSGDKVLVVLVCAVSLVTVAAGVRARLRDGPGWPAGLLLAVGLFEVGLLPETLQRLDEVHLGFVACFTVPAAMLLLPERGAWPGALRRAGSLAWATSGATAIVLAFVFAWPTYFTLYRSEVSAWGHAVPEVAVTNEGRSVPAGPSGDPALASLLHAVDERARPGDRLFVGPADLRTADYNDTYLYFLLPQLQPGTFYLEMDPGVANGAGSGLAGQISRDRFVILTAQSGTSPAGGQLGPDAPNKVVQQQFVEVGSWGQWTLLEKRS